MAARLVAICTVFFGTLSINDAIILCRNVQVICKRSDTACYSGPCAQAAPDLYTIIDDDDDTVSKPEPIPLIPPLLGVPPNIAAPLIPQQSGSSTGSAMDIIPKFKDDAAGDYLNALPIVETITDDLDSDTVDQRGGRPKESKGSKGSKGSKASKGSQGLKGSKGTRTRDSEGHRAVMNPVVSQNHGQFVSVHSAPEPASSVGEVTNGRTILMGLLSVWMFACVLMMCCKRLCIHRKQVVEKDGSVMVAIEDESDESCEEPDEYVTTPEPPLMKDLEEDV